MQIVGDEARAVNQKHLSWWDLAVESSDCWRALLRVLLFSDSPIRCAFRAAIE